jgi:hypothetical protein
MKITKIIIALLILGLTSMVRADIPAAKRQEIEKMLKLTGMEKLVDQMMSQMMSGMQAQMTNVPSEFWASFSKKVKAADLIEKLMPLYDKYYSIEDLRAVNAFYSSPAGQRMLSTMPQLMQESMLVGQEWGAKISQQAMEEAQAEIAKKE